MAKTMFTIDWDDDLRSSDFWSELTGVIVCIKPGHIVTTKGDAVKTPEEICRRLVERLTTLTSIEWSFGYLGNVYANGTEDRLWYAFAAHPGRVGTEKDRIGGVPTNDLDRLVILLHGAVQLATVQTTAR